MTSQFTRKKVELNPELWDTVYASKGDTWTREAIDDVLLEFSDNLTQGKANQYILVPLCGRNQIMLRLADQGHKVVGIEWSQIAVVAFFEENNLAYEELTFNLKGKESSMFRAKEKHITIYCGDFFAFDDVDVIGPFDCILDHGSIGCFDNDRTSYAAIINSFTKPGGRVLLSIFDYNHSEHPTLPYAVTESEVNSLFKHYFKTITLLKELDAKSMAETFHLESPECHFPVLTLSRMAWKIMLMKK